MVQIIFTPNLEIHATHFPDKSKIVVVSGFLRDNVTYENDTVRLDFIDHNNIVDANGFKAYDHSDQNTRRVFGVMAGPGIPSSLPSIGSEQNPVGDLLNITPTIAEILGFKELFISFIKSSLFFCFSFK